LVALTNVYTLSFAPLRDVLAANVNEIGLNDDWEEVVAAMSCWGLDIWLILEVEDLHGEIGAGSWTGDEGVEWWL